MSDNSGSEKDEGEDEGVFTVEKILKKRIRRGVTEYYLKWKDFDDSENSWEPEDNVKSCQDLVDEFEEQWQKKLQAKKNEPQSSRKRKTNEAAHSNLSDDREKEREQNQFQQPDECTAATERIPNDDNIENQKKKKKLLLPTKNGKTIDSSSSSDDDSNRDEKKKKKPGKPRKYKVVNRTQDSGKKTITKKNGLATDKIPNGSKKPVQKKTVNFALPENDEASSGVAKNEKKNIKDIPNILNEIEKRRSAFDKGLKPEKVLGATNADGTLVFLIKWSDSEDADLVSSKEARQKCPELLLDFYESHLQWS